MAHTVRRLRGWRQRGDRMTSIKDVAASVGVSTATVSRALRGLPRVSDETRVRVLKAAAELDYVASPSAAGLATGQTRAVGVIVPFVTRWFFGSVIQGAEELLREAGYDLLLYNLGGDQEARDRVFRGHLLRKRVDAVLVLSLTPTDEEVGVADPAGPAGRCGRRDGGRVVERRGSTTWRPRGSRCGT